MKEIPVFNFKMLTSKSVVRKYGIITGAVLFLIVYTVIVSAVSSHNARVEAEERLSAEYKAYYDEQILAYQDSQSAKYFLSGEASREAFINQEIDAGARLASAMKNDEQKGGIIGNAVARTMNPNYPNTIQENVDMPDQWMFYKSTNKFTPHDREIAESIIRPYYENGVIPNGLTDQYVYGKWSENHYVLRDTWSEKESHNELVYKNGEYR